MRARILVIRPGALGDTVLALPALQALATSRAPATLELVGYPSVLRLVEHAVPSLPVRKIHSIDRSLFAPLFHGPVSDELQEFLTSFDLVVAWVHDRSGSLRAKLSRLGISHRQSDPHPPPGSRTHASQHLLATLAPPRRRLDKLLAAPRVQASREALEECGKILHALELSPRGFIAMHPGSGSARKNWPAENFAALLRMAQNAGRRVLVLEGEADSEPVRKVCQSAGLVPACLREPALPILTAMLAEAAAFVGNDSGVTHLAAATGTSTLAIFGPTDPTIWAPRGRCVRVLGLDTPVEDVWRELGRLLVRSQASGGVGGNPRETSW